MENDTNNNKERLGDDAPGIKHILMVFAVVGLLIALSWIAWFKWGCFH